jgi:hypothetical protein
MPHDRGCRIRAPAAVEQRSSVASGKSPGGTSHAVASSTMNTIQTVSAFTTVALGILVSCCTPPESAISQPVVPGTEGEPGVTSQQAVADAEVVERIATARCDRSQSCDRIGLGANYRDRNDCMRQARELVSRQLNASHCPGGIGEVGVSRCVSSLGIGECDTPGQVYGTVSHCELDLMCLR